jgi:hypothetical protein
MELRDLLLRNYDCQVTIKPSSGMNYTWKDASLTFVKGKQSIWHVLNSAKCTLNPSHSERLATAKNWAALWRRSEGL